MCLSNFGTASLWSNIDRRSSSSMVMKQQQQQSKALPLISSSSSSSNPHLVVFKEEEQQQRSSLDNGSAGDKNKQQPPPHHRHRYPHIVVQHDYHDHSRDPKSWYPIEHPARGGVSTQFPIRLHTMLKGVQEDGLEHIVSWQPHGRAFVVHKPKEFADIVLPKYFKLSKLASFQRQVNLYGFQRLTRGKDRGAYYNELFLRDKVWMAHSIQRIKVKGTGVRARSNPEQEPDLWSLPFIQEDGEVEEDTTSSVVGDNTTSPDVHTSSQQQQQQQQGMSNWNEQVQEQNLLLPKNNRAFDKGGQEEDDDDVVATSFGKSFHFLKHVNSTLLEPPPSSQEHNMTAQPDQQKNEDAECDMFFADLDFDDSMLSLGAANLEDDEVFGDILASMILG